jgi:Antitoxin MazE-like
VPSSNPANTRDKVRAHRARLRRRGLRPIQMWVSDVRSPSFALEAHRQSALVASAQSEREEQAFVDANSEWPPE